MATRPIKVTKAYALNPSDIEMIQLIAEERAISKSEAVRFILNQFRLAQHRRNNRSKNSILETTL